MKRGPLELGDLWAGEREPRRGHDVLAAIALVVLSVLTAGAIAGVAYLFTVGP